MATSTELHTATPGYALLIAADAPVRHPLAATAALPQLAAIPPARLVGTPQASSLQLANPDDPNTVHTALRTAAAVEGPLLVYVAGQLTLDPRQHRLHLALARTVPRTVRYTALPWHWLTAALQHRPPGSTAVLADLAADPRAWDALAGDDTLLTGALTLFGTVQLHDRRRSPAPAYTHALVQVLRTSAPSGIEQLHRDAARATRLEAATTRWLGGHPTAAEPGLAQPDARGDVIPVPASLAVPRPRTSTPAHPPAVPAPTAADEPHAEVFAAAAAGRHGEAAAMAAAWEQDAMRAHGPESAQAVHWIEVQAELARQAGDPARASNLWMRSAIIRLTTGQDAEHPDVAAAVDRAHHCWHQVSDADAARQLGIELSTLRARVPGSGKARRDVQARLAKLTEANSP